MSSTFETLLAKDGYLIYRTRGVSMEPMLRQNRDLVIIKVPSSRLKKYDVAFYKRGGAYVLHRVIKAAPDHYLIRGDNTYALETVPDEAVLGVLTGFKRKGKDHTVSEPAYRMYVRVWDGIYPVRAVVYRARKCAARAALKLGILPFLKKVMHHE